MDLPSRSFAIPVAFTAEGRIVRPDQAEPGQVFRCPGCSAEVVLRQGELRQAHFAHRHGEGCSPESAAHRAAKRLVVEVVLDWKDRGGPRPCIARSCPRFGCEGGTTQDIPEDITHAAEEVRLSDGSIGDVVLFRGDHAAAAIEIRATHRVSEEKARRLAIPWVELDAAEVLERPYWWMALQDGLQPFRCPVCARAEAERAAEVDEIQRRAVALAQRTRTTLPPSPPYYYAPHTCWRCGAEMVAFIWPGSANHSRRRPPDPIPCQVQHRMTDSMGNYWANCCPTCSALQGDHYLRTENQDYICVHSRVQLEVADDLW